MPPAIQKAPEQLGYGPCYHMRVAMNQYPRDCAMWKQALEAKYDRKGKLFGREEWDQLLGRYRVRRLSQKHHSTKYFHQVLLFFSSFDSQRDWECNLLIKAVRQRRTSHCLCSGPYARLSSAKIILSNRDPESWHASVSRTVLQSRLYWLYGILQHFDWATGLVHPLRVKIWQCLFNDDFEHNGREAMKLHYEEVRACAKLQDREVLELHLGNGWDQLCKFLQVAVPQEPYPRENDSDGFIAKMRERAKLRMRAVALRWLRGGLMVAALIFVARLVGRRLPAREGRLLRGIQGLVSGVAGRAIPPDLIRPADNTSFHAS